MCSLLDNDEHPRETRVDTMTKLEDVMRPEDTVISSNVSGVKCGACALLRGPVGPPPRGRV